MVEWIDDRIEQMLQRPTMFGPLDSVELDIITLLDARDFALHKESINRYNNFTEYLAFVKQIFPDEYELQQLSKIFLNNKTEFCRCMREFVQYQQMK